MSVSALFTSQRAQSDSPRCLQDEALALACTRPVVQALVLRGRRWIDDRRDEGHPSGYRRVRQDPTSKERDCMSFVAFPRRGNSDDLVSHTQQMKQIGRLFLLRVNISLVSGSMVDSPVRRLPCLVRSQSHC